MDRGWYLRFAFLLGCVVCGGAVLWPSVANWTDTEDSVPPFLKDVTTIASGLDIQGGLRLIAEGFEDRGVGHGFLDARERDLDV